MKHWEEVNISNFSGPLDLLYTMVKEKKINIMELNLIEISNQYLDYINSQQNLDIEIASEYLTMAATLLEIKSRLLLPNDDIVENDGDDYSYEDFIEQLSRYEQIRQVSDFFALKQQEYFDTYAPKKSNKKFEFVEVEEPELDLDITMDKFVEIYKRALQKQQMFLFEDNFEIDDYEEFNTIETAVLSPKEITEMILEVMNENRLKDYSIMDLLKPEIMNLKNLISIFLSVLDLVKYQIVTVSQNEDDTDLIIRFTKYAIENPEALNGLEVEGYE